MNNEYLNEIESISKEYLGICADIELGKINLSVAGNIMQTINRLNVLIANIPVGERKTNDFYYILIEMAYNLYLIRDDNFSS